MSGLGMFHVSSHIMQELEFELWPLLLGHHEFLINRIGYSTLDATHILKWAEGRRTFSSVLMVVNSAIGHYRKGWWGYINSSTD